MEGKRCTDCGEVKPITHDYWGSTPSGNFRGYCNQCMNRRSREYEAKNKDKRKVRDVRRAAAGGGQRRSFSLSEKQHLFRQQDGQCVGCFERIERPELGEVDHMKPLSKGGADDASNFILMHARCNRDKKDRTLQGYWEWRMRVGMDNENLGRKNGMIP